MSIRRLQRHYVGKDIQTSEWCAAAWQEVLIYRGTVVNQARVSSPRFLTCLAKVRFFHPSFYIVDDNQAACVLPLADKAVAQDPSLRTSLVSSGRGLRAGVWTLVDPPLRKDRCRNVRVAWPAGAFLTIDLLGRY